MYLLKAFVRFACFDVFYMITKGILDFAWGASIPDTLVYELFTTTSIIPVFLISDFLIHLLEKRVRFIYFYDMLVMLLSVSFITVLWRRIPGTWDIWNRGLHMMSNWADVKILYSPLLASAVLGYGLYVWTLKNNG